jgi:hypothetical protein
MISHELKCIFIHIPRCAGSSVEKWLTSKDWWSIEPATKHLTVRQAKSLYEDYWDDYFKFTIVRHPVDRCRSCLKFEKHFGLSLQPDGKIDFSGYHALFGEDITVEYDHRFYSSDDVRHNDHKKSQVYGNIIDAPLDFIGRYERLKSDMKIIQKELGVRQDFDVHIEKSNLTLDGLYPETIRKIEALYEQDFELFGYS